jgi:hypothetical protein
VQTYYGFNLVLFSYFFDPKTSPRIRFNKGGNLLAVSANDNRIKILATVDGLCLMRTFESHSLVASRVGIASEAPIKVSNFVFHFHFLAGYAN